MGLETWTCTWTWHFYAALLVFLLVILLNRLWLKGKRKLLLTPVRLWIIGVFASAVILLLPVYAHDLAETGASFGRVFLSSLHQAIQMFTLDADRGIIMKLPVAKAPVSRLAYGILAAELIAAPMLTFVLVISFFEDLWGFIRYRLNPKRDAYVFSELNERSVALAKSIRKKDRRALLMFTDVFRKEEEGTYELIEEAKALNAVLQKKDIRLMKFGVLNGRIGLYFFTIGDDETENLVQALRLIDVYRERERTWLYVFSSRIECELLLNTKDAGKMTVRRIDAIQSLVYNHLYEKGYAIFRAAKEAAGNAEEEPVKVHCLVVGMGQHGTEMVKALSWFGQMPRYEILIDAYDLDEHAEERFAAQCPELMEEDKNRPDREDDAAYRINIHGDTDVTLPSFEKSVLALKDVCYVFVALGSDMANIRAAVALRTLFAGLAGASGDVPLIETIIYQNDEIRALNEVTAGKAGAVGIADYEGTPYNIRFIGSLDETYSVNTIFNSEPEKEAEKYHTQWAETEEMEEEKRKLYKYGYFYRSSYSAVIHVHTLVQVLREQHETANTVMDRKDELKRLEHCRWNAYMRAEGYRYAETTNRLGKLHKDLMPYGRLDPEERKKDDYMQFIIELMNKTAKAEADAGGTDGPQKGG